MPHRIFQLDMSILKPAVGFFCASASAIVAQISDNIPPEARGWVEGGAYVTLVASLGYAVWTMWKKLNQRDIEIAALNLEIRTEQKQQNERLIQALNRFDPDHK